MGTSLNGLTPSATYSGLIKFGDNSAISASLKYISDGDGNDTLLAMSTTSLNIGATNIDARVGIKGSGSTSATTSFLVQNSAGNAAFTVRDDLNATFGNGISTPNASILGDGTVRLNYLQTQYGGIVGALAYPSSGAIFEVRSTNSGFLPPRMTTTQKGNIASPPEGLVVYDTTLGKLCVRTASAWETITSI